MVGFGEDDERYSRQVLFAGIGAAGQARLGAAAVAIVGVGATGAATASLLARAGVGRLRLIDRDFVEASNLQRQILFDEADACEALPKAEAARRHILAFNSTITVEARIADLVPANVYELLDGVELVLDCSDNFETRYLLNDYCVEQGKPWIYAGAVGAQAATMNILPGDTACLACLFPSAPLGAGETCDTAGILGMAVNLAASVQACEALKVLCGGDGVRRSFLSFDLWGNGRAEIAAGRPRVGCRVCGDRVFEHLAGVGRAHVTLCGRNSVQIHEGRRAVSLPVLIEKLRGLRDVSELRGNGMLVRFRRGELVVTVFADGRALVQGTTDVAVARSVYARFVGA